MMKCKYCNRDIKKDMITPKGCVWCDSEYRLSLPNREQDNVMTKRKVIGFDFDGVISKYFRPWIWDELGEPVEEIVETMKYYYKKGYYILILTGRHSTPKMIEWLKKHNVPYDGFNVNPKPHMYASRFKAYVDAYIDDKNISFDFQHNKKSKEQLIKEIDKIIELGDAGKEV